MQGKYCPQPDVCFLCGQIGLRQDEPTDIQPAAGPAIADGKRPYGAYSRFAAEEFYRHSGGRGDLELPRGAVGAFLLHAEGRQGTGSLCVVQAADAWGEDSSGRWVAGERTRVDQRL